MRKSMVILVLGIMMAAATAHAASGDDILGVWNNAEKDANAKIEIFKCNGKYCGKIVFAKEPNYPADSKKGHLARRGLMAKTLTERKSPGPSSVSRS